MTMAPTPVTSPVDVMERHGANPIITPDQIAPSNSAFRVRGAFNPGAAVVGDEVVLLLRVAEDVPTGAGRVAVPIIRHEGEVTVSDVLEVDPADPDVVRHDNRRVYIDGVEYPTTMSHLRVARSCDGVHFTVEEAPFLLPDLASERHGVEDPRITQIGDRWVVTYTAVSSDGWATGLLETFDFRSFDRLGLIFHPDNRHTAILPGRNGGLYQALHRPTNSRGPSAIWFAESPDLLHWGNHHTVMHAEGTAWDSQSIGAGPPPILTDDGWLQLYNAEGVGSVFSLWAVLLDRHDPTRVLARGIEPMLVPEAPYEVDGFFGNAVLSNGMVERNGELFVYYGAADEVTCLARTTVDAVMDTLR